MFYQRALWLSFRCTLESSRLQTKLARRQKTVQARPHAQKETHAHSNFLLEKLHTKLRGGSVKALELRGGKFQEPHQQNHSYNLWAGKHVKRLKPKCCTKRKASVCMPLCLCECADRRAAWPHAVLAGLST